MMVPASHYMNRWDQGVGPLKSGRWAQKTTGTGSALHGCLMHGSAWLEKTSKNEFLVIEIVDLPIKNGDLVGFNGIY